MRNAFVPQVFSDITRELVMTRIFATAAAALLLSKCGGDSKPAEPAAVIRFER